MKKGPKREPCTHTTVVFPLDWIDGNEKGKCHRCGAEVIVPLPGNRKRNAKRAARPKRDWAERAARRLFSMHYGAITISAVAHLVRRARKLKEADLKAAEKRD